MQHIHAEQKGLSNRNRAVDDGGDKRLGSITQGQPDRRALLAEYHTTAKSETLLENNSADRQRQADFVQHGVVSGARHQTTLAQNTGVTNGLISQLPPTSFTAATGGKRSRVVPEEQQNGLLLGNSDGSLDELNLTAEKMTEIESKREERRMRRRTSIRKTFARATTAIGLSQALAKRRNDDPMSPSTKNNFMEAFEANLDDVEAREMEGEVIHSSRVNTQAGNTSWVIDPRSKKIQRWTLYVFALTLFTGTVTPFEVAYLDSEVDPSNFLWLLNRFVDSSFVVDMVITFFQSYYDEFKGVWVVGLPAIASRYMRCWFWVDLLSVLPYDLAGAAFSSDDVEQLKVLRVIKLARLFKLLRLFRARRMFANFEAEYNIDYSQLALIKFVSVVLLLMHLMACGLNILATIENSENNWVTENACNFEYMCTGAPVGDTQQPAIWQIYMAAMYWATMTISTIGYGDITMITHGERVYAIVCMMVGASTYAYTVGAICGVLANLDRDQAQFTQDMSDLNKFMSEVALGQEMRVRLRQYFQRVRHVPRLHKHDVLLRKMSPTLRCFVANHWHSKWVRKVPFFRNCKATFVARIALVMQMHTFAPRETIISYLDFADRMYIMQSGMVICAGKIHTPHLSPVFGTDVIMSHHRRVYTARSLQYVDIYVMFRSDLFTILQNFPTVTATVRKAAIRMSFKEGIIEAIKKSAAASSTRDTGAFEEKRHHHQRELMLMDAATEAARGGDVVSSYERMRGATIVAPKNALSRKTSAEIREGSMCRVEESLPPPSTGDGEATLDVLSRKVDSLTEAVLRLSQQVDRGTMQQPSADSDRSDSLTPLGELPPDEQTVDAAIPNSVQIMQPNLSAQSSLLTMSEAQY